MTNFLKRLLLLTAALSSPGVVSAYSHANRYGGTTAYGANGVHYTVIPPQQP
jgi:hypothetical protein